MGNGLFRSACSGIGGRTLSEKKNANSRGGGRVEELTARTDPCTTKFSRNSESYDT